MLSDPVRRDPSADCPTAVFLLPPVVPNPLDPSAEFPSAVLKFPSSLFLSADFPTAVFWLPKALNRSAFCANISETTEAKKLGSNIRGGGQSSENDEEGNESFNSNKVGKAGREKGSRRRRAVGKVGNSGHK